MIDAYCKLTDIAGESTDSKHQDWVEVIGYHHNISQPSSGSVSSQGGRSSERCDHADFYIVKKTDKATPLLLNACCTGTHVKEVQVSVARSGGTQLEYMNYTMNDVIIRSVMVRAVQDSELPAEEIAFAYGKITWTYTETDHKTGAKKGAITKGWDLHTNKAV